MVTVRSFFVLFALSLLLVVSGLTAYAVGIYDSGKLVYKKYTSSCTLVGY